MRSVEIGRWRWIAISLVGTFAAVSSGCVGDDPVPDNTPSSDAGAEAAAEPIERFLGTWTTSTASQALSNCAGAGTQQNISITLAVTKGSTSDIVATNSLAPNCSFDGDIAGDTATFRARTCTQTTDAVYTYSYSAANTFKLTDSTHAVMEIKATITNNLGQSCDFTEIAPYAKR
jgi:hypothetical protein